MIRLYQFIFCRIFYFYTTVFKEREIPHYFAGAIVAVIIMSNVAIIVEGLYLSFGPPWMEVSGWLKYIGLVLIICLAYLLNKNDRYQSILNQDKKLGRKKRNVLVFLSVLYILGSILILVALGFKIRAL